MSGLQAAFITPAVGKIPHVMEDRNRIARLYRSELQGVSGLTLMPVNSYGQDTPWVFGVLAESKAKRKILRQALAKEGYETRDYFFPLHLQPISLTLTKQLSSLPNAEDMGARGFYLPTYYGIPKNVVESICRCLKNAV